jgi:uncharacterized membrane protein
MNYELFIRLMAPYHSVLVHFPVAVWTTTALVVAFRVFFDNSYAKAAGKLLPLLAGLGVASGIAAYAAGFFIFSPTAAGASPLIRNHILGGSWSIAYWSVFGITAWRLGESAWHGMNNWLMLALAGLGTLFITITGTIGGHIAGNPTSVSMMLELLGWDVHDTFFVPNPMLSAIVVGAVLLPLIAWFARNRNRIH